MQCSKNTRKQAIHAYNSFHAALQHNRLMALQGFQISHLTLKGN